MIGPYPDSPAARDRWILERRGPRNRVDPLVPSAFLFEEETDETGSSVPIATVFLTNRECPWRCLMCDLWQNTLPDDTPKGAVIRQIRAAVAALPAARWIKLYNSGSFFDPRAIPEDETEAIVRELSRFERVIVESHPALVGARCGDLARRLGGRLEVAMGLETIHPEILPRLNKRMSLSQFREAAEFLRAEDIALRAFVLVGLPWLDPAEAVEWAVRVGRVRLRLRRARRLAHPDPHGQRRDGGPRGRGRLRAADAGPARAGALGGAGALPRARVRGPLGPRALAAVSRLLLGTRAAPGRDEPAPGAHTPGGVPDLRGTRLADDGGLRRRDRRARGSRAR